MSARIVVVGDLMVDVVAALPGELARGSDTPARIAQHQGGSGANVAAWLASAGAAVAFAGRAGADPLGDAAIVVANPLPEAEQLDPALHARVLEDGLAAAERAGATGKDATPFLLDFFHRETEGASLEVNVRIVLRNARLAAAIAAA